jgi:SAM-dependent methyltransferase
MDLACYLDLGRQPLANSYHKGDETLLTFPLSVNLCRRCFHSQLSIVVPPEQIFRRYLYVSGTTETFRRHCQELAKNALPRTRARRPRVLDIACNDGTLLGYFRELHCDVQGVDPALNLREITEKKGIPVVTDFWGERVAHELKPQGSYDVITGTNVLAHVADPLRFLEATKLVLAPQGFLVIEFPYGDETVERCEFDQIYHEHVSYFLARSFAALASRAGFTIKDVLRTPIHGGSIRFFLEPGAEKHCDKVSHLIEEESLKGLHREKTYRNFAKRVEKSRAELPKLLSKAKAEGRAVLGYGASAKGNTMLNHFEVDLEYVVDDNPLKWELKTPGRNIPIRSPSVLAKEPRPISIVVLSWNFLEEIKRKILEIRGPGRGDRYVLYVPSVREEPLEIEWTRGVA